MGDPFEKGRRTSQKQEKKRGDKRGEKKKKGEGPPKKERHLSAGGGACSKCREEDARARLKSRRPTSARRPNWGGKTGGFTRGNKGALTDPRERTANLSINSFRKMGTVDLPTSAGKKGMQAKRGRKGVQQTLKWAENDMLTCVPGSKGVRRDLESTQG